MPNASMVTQTWPHRALQVDLRGGGGRAYIYIYIYMCVYICKPPTRTRFGSAYTVNANRNNHFWVLILIHGLRLPA